MSPVDAVGAQCCFILLLSQIGASACQVAPTSSQPTLASATTSEARPFPDGGPVAQGLQLRLAIRDTDQIGSGRHAFDLTLRNTSSMTVMVGTDPVPGHDGEGSATFADAVHHFVWFAVYPEIPYEMPQVGFSEPVQVEPYALGGGEELNFSWDTPNDRLRSRSPSWTLPAGFLFPSDGLYFVRVGMDLKVGHDESVRIWSNEVPVSVGGKHTPPKPPIAIVRSFDSETGDCILDVGNISGVQVGDVYEVPMGGLGSGWRFVVGEVKSTIVHAHGEQFGVQVGEMPMSRQEQVLAAAHAILRRPRGAPSTARPN